MNIGIDATPMFRERGGIGWYTYHLTRALARIDHTNTYVLYRDSSSSSRDDPGIEQHNFAMVEVPRWRMRRQAKNDAVEVFHGTSYKLPAYGSHGNVITVHDLALDAFPQHSRKFLGQRWASWRSKRVLSRADALIAVSNHTAQDIDQRYGISRSRIHVVHHGGAHVDTAVRHTVPLSSVKQRYGLRGDGYILHVGGGEPRKNVLGLLDAYAALGVLRRQYQLVLVGSMGRWKEQVAHKIGRLELGTDVRITGYLRQEHLVTLYKHATLFVYPSLYEGFGIPPLEAMASGVPVITSNTSCFPEIVGDAAVMVDPLQPSALAQAMTAILCGADIRDRLRQKGLCRAKQFSWEQTARNTLAVYTSVFRAAYDRSHVH